MTNDVYVKIAEAKTGKSGERLRSVLGSCIGIAFLWKSRGLYGLAHCLLPEAQGQNSFSSAKFVSQAVPVLMKLMKIQNEDVADIEVHIAGGGNMIPHLAKTPSDDIGRMNIEAARKYLSMAGFKIKSEDVGGFCGRQLFINCNDGSIRVDVIEKNI